MVLDLQTYGRPFVAVGKAQHYRALYLAVVHRTTIANWLWWRVWHVRLAWPPVRKMVDHFVKAEDGEG